MPYNQQPASSNQLLAVVLPGRIALAAGRQKLTAKTMSRLAQLGVFTSVVGIVATFMGLFPGAMTVNGTPSIGLGQIILALVGLTLLTVGAYVLVYALWHRALPRTLTQDIGVRLGLTGLTFAVATSLADVLGFGSHTLGSGFTFGRVQAVGMALGFLMAAAGVVIYGLRR